MYAHTCVYLSLSFVLSFSPYIYIYIYIYMCKGYQCISAGASFRYIPVGSLEPPMELMVISMSVYLGSS